MPTWGKIFLDQWFQLRTNGRVFLKGAPPSSGRTYTEVLSSKKLASVEGESLMHPGAERQKYAFQSFGAQFVEVKVDPDIARARITRIVSAFDVGKVVDPKTARSQGYSGVITGNWHGV
jgi:xanthine dehydrogenase YagR molybdenum-binding subunit